MYCFVSSLIKCIHSFLFLKKTEEYYQQIVEAADYVRKNLGTAEIALVLGSGLNGLTKLLTDPKV